MVLMLHKNLCTSNLGLGKDLEQFETILHEHVNTYIAHKDWWPWRTKKQNKFEFKNKFKHDVLVMLFIVVNALSYT